MTKPPQVGAKIRQATLERILDRELPEEGAVKLLWPLHRLAYKQELLPTVWTQPGLFERCGKKTFRRIG